MRNLILILLFIPTYMFCQGWEKTYGGYGDDIGFSVKQLTDGGYIITGCTNSFGNGDEDVYLIKTDNNGDTIYTRTYGGDEDDKGYSIQQTNDGGYIITGQTKSFSNGGRDVYLIKTDSNGDTLWTKVYGGDGDDYGYSVQQTTDGGYVITGFTNSYGNGYDVYLIKTDDNGDTLWTKVYGGDGPDFGKSVQQTTDDGYVITGHTKSYGNGGRDVYLIKTDSNGDTIWTKVYGGYGYDVGNSVQQTTDEGFIITGYTNSYGNSCDVYLIKTDINGDTLWTKIFIGDYSYGGNSVQQTTDGGYIITGYTSYPSPGDVCLIKTDTNGDTLWIKTFGGDGDVDDVGWSVDLTTDDGYIITGMTNSNENSNDFWNVYLIKTNEVGSVSFTSVIPVPNRSRKLVKMVDLSGREINTPLKNQPYIEIFNDGSTKKKINVR